jgi:hypothetical protein
MVANDMSYLQLIFFSGDISTAAGQYTPAVSQSVTAATQSATADLRFTSILGNCFEQLNAF